MSKKNLARTAIEGGRSAMSKWQRKNSNKELRAKETSYLKAVEKDPEVWDEDEYPVRRTVGKEFHDKLGPVYRYLQSQVGRPWDKVRSEVFEKFDARTTAGRHILHDHLLSLVEYNELGFRKAYYNYWKFLDQRESFSSREYYVDKNGLLQLKKKISDEEYQQRLEKNSKDLKEFSKNRVIRFFDGKPFWLKSKNYYVIFSRSFVTYQQIIKFAFLENSIDGEEKFPEASFQVDIELSKEEIKELNSFPEKLRKLIIV